MKSRWKTDKPMSRTAFNARFPDNAACARYLFSARWPEGFVCPACKSRKAWELKTKLYTYECACCGKQTSVTAGTVMHRSKLPLLVWFQAIHIMTSHSNGISAEQAQAQLGLGSYKTAWLLLMKLRRAMADPARSLLSGIVEVDETEVPLRSKHDPIAGYVTSGVNSTEFRRIEFHCRLATVSRGVCASSLGAVEDATVLGPNPCTGAR
jgi:hypothetical protein